MFFKASKRMTNQTKFETFFLSLKDGIPADRYNISVIKEISKKAWNEAHKEGYLDGKEYMNDVNERIMAENDLLRMYRDAAEVDRKRRYQ